ncbi:MAG: sensor histidine kinase [Brachybacterium sp.]|uniref:sensor histidine kinase n=1 Tax=Brachybacterium sp. TaxID=1891286 RepID=UPI002648663E|nr:sensor histidine kinase [Brachybacterium sp.]MDN5688294.1 sensor histidine kinase [Brachybacterium sp.]
MKQSAPVHLSSVAPASDVSGPGSWLRGRIWLIDLLVAAGVFFYSVPILPLFAHSSFQFVALVLVSAVICGSYVLRRRYPVRVLGIILVAASVQVLLQAPVLPADAMLLVAVYNVATRYTWRVSILGAVLSVAWLLVAVVPRLGDELIDVSQLGVLIMVTLWVWTWGTLVRIRRQYVAGLQERAEQAEREQETNARIAVADERARIAREIHDIVSHGLSAVVLMSDGAAAKVESEPERAKTAMLRVRDTGRDALTEMRRMLDVLRDDEPGSDAPQPDITQLEALVEQSRTAGIPVDLAVNGVPSSKADGLGLTVYRLVQEALTNARKHAGPSLTRVTVRIDYRPDEVEVHVADDGHGTTADVTESGGHGLLGMRERVAAHDGTLRVDAAEAGGFEIVAVLPRSEGAM